MPTISHENILWSTRGKEWGFRFIHKPEKYSEFSELIYQKIFPTDERVPVKWWGCIRLPGSQVVNYVACRFFDPDNRWTDSAGREIPHELLVLLDDNRASEIVDLDWELTIFEDVREYYRVVYEKSIDGILPLPFLHIERLSAHISSVNIASTSYDFDLTTSKTISNSCAEEGKSSLPAHQTIWNVLNTDVTEILGTLKSRSLKK